MDIIKKFILCLTFVIASFFVFSQAQTISNYKEDLQQSLKEKYKNEKEYQIKKLKTDGDIYEAFIVYKKKNDNFFKYEYSEIVFYNKHTDKFLKEKEWKKNKELVKFYNENKDELGKKLDKKSITLLVGLVGSLLLVEAIFRIKTKRQTKS